MTRTIEQLVDEGIDRIHAANPGCRIRIRYENASGRKVQHEGCLSIWECRNIESLGYRTERGDEKDVVLLVVVF